MSSPHTRIRLDEGVTAIRSEWITKTLEIGNKQFVAAVFVDRERNRLYACSSGWVTWKQAYVFDISGLPDTWSRRPVASFNLQPDRHTTRSLRLDTYNDEFTIMQSTEYMNASYIECFSTNDGALLRTLTLPPAHRRLAEAYALGRRRPFYVLCRDGAVVADDGRVVFRVPDMTYSGKQPLLFEVSETLDRAVVVSVDMMSPRTEGNPYGTPHRPLISVFTLGTGAEVIRFPAELHPVYQTVAGEHPQIMYEGMYIDEESSMLYCFNKDYADAYTIDSGKRVGTLRFRDAENAEVIAVWDMKILRNPEPSIVFATSNGVAFMPLDEWIESTWTPQRHAFTSRPVRRVVKVTTMIRSLEYQTPLAALPNELLFEIFGFL